MPYFSLDHLTHSLDYLTTHVHTAMTSLLAMLREGVPLSDNPDLAVPFGARQENRLMADYLSPVGGPEDKPFFIPFQSQQGKSRWRDTSYAGRSLQRQRGDRPEIFIKHPSDKHRWMLSPRLPEAIRARAAEVVGDVPIVVAYLAIWFYRNSEFTNVGEAVAEFISEFQLDKVGLVGDIFTDHVPDIFLEMPMVEEPVDQAELLTLLQKSEPEARIGADSEPPPKALEPGSVAIAPEAAGSWDISSHELGDLCGLKGLEEVAFRALAALKAGKNIIFTGPPGTGKTKLAECICRKAGFSSWTVPATDQWTTFETIGGYFPSPGTEGTADRLDFLAGAVVDAIEKGRCLIIDEINRADIDKAFGELFTLLSGNSVTLPFRRRVAGSFRRVRLQIGAAVVEDDVTVIPVPSWWRIIGAMNDADKASLKRLSLAFIRRFAFIPVLIPEPEVYRSILRNLADRLKQEPQYAQTINEYRETLDDLFTEPESGFSGVGLPMGPAIPLAMLEHVASELRMDPTRTPADLLMSTLDLYVIPQFQGRADLHDDVVELVAPLIEGGAQEFNRKLAVWTGAL